jgi:alkanesulfonate monooxygenase SsuD/methylene tetrahydromethanopterin reductase-like flavin-dependent oxidoreductase (luciferase family)
MLQFGLALPMSSNQHEPSTFFREIAREVQVAEDSGFDLCLVPEHHGGPRASLNDPLAVVSWLLGQTHSITIGTGVLILPLHSIPRLAEQSAFIHCASGGRLFLGVGAGYQQDDFALFGVRPEERGGLLDAGIDALRTAWATGEISGRPVRPALDGIPAPRLAIGAWTDGGLRRAAQSGDAWLADPIHTHDEVVAAAERYRSLAVAHDQPTRTVIMREAWVAETDELATAQFRPVIEPVFRYYHRNGALSAGTADEPVDLALPGGLSDRVVCGSASTVTTTLSDIAQRTQAETIVLGLRHPAGPSHEEVLAAIARLGEEILPAVRISISAGRLADDRR